MTLDDLAEWAPFSLRWESSGPVLDWRRMGRRRFVEPLFDQTIQKHGQEAPSVNRTTPAATLLDRMAILPERPLTGFVFIFHASRCGSTLVAQMLASLPRNVVLSEPAILDSVLFPELYRKPHGNPANDVEQVQLFRAIVRALGHPRHPEEQYCFVKFSSRAISKMPLIQQAFPDVPWIFLYREPEEIMSAWLRFSGECLPPGIARAGLIEGNPAELAKMHPEEFWARVLAARFSDVLRFYEPGKVLLMNYTQLPEAVCGPMLKFFDATCSPEEMERMREAATLNAKAPSRKFRNDSDEKRGTVPASVRELVDSLVMPHYRKLEAIRTGEPFGAKGPE